MHIIATETIPFIERLYFAMIIPVSGAAGLLAVALVERLQARYRKARRR